MKAFLFVPLRDALHDRRIVLALAVAFVFRLILAVVVFGPANYTVNDSPHYLNSGANLFTHGTFAIVCDPKCIPTLMRTPVYPVLLGVMFAVLKLPLFFICILQALFDTVTTWIVATFGVELGGGRVGVAAAFVYALDPFAAAYAGQIMTESLATLLIVVALYLVWRLSEPGAPRRPIAWAAVGALSAITTLVRPAMGALPAAMAVAAFRPSEWRRQAVAWSTAAVTFCLVIAPWTARNLVVTRNGEADDSFRVVSSFLGPFDRRMMTHGMTEWFNSYEEPFAGENFYTAPSVARYLLPNERERVEALFRKIRDNLGEISTVERPGPAAVTKELDAEFAQLAHERRVSHPFRTIVLPPLTRVPRLWIVPRLSSLNMKPWRLAGAMGTLLIVGATAYNSIQVLLGLFGGIIAVARSIPARIVASAPLYLTVFHALYAFGNQSRYTVPGLPEVTVLAGLGFFVLLDRVRKRPDSCRLGAV
jgi:4-amino-4-deoxy-L-arabinose transferase-like glycosyltransferase